MGWCGIRRPRPRESPCGTDKRNGHLGSDYHVETVHLTLDASDPHLASNDPRTGARRGGPNR